MIKKYVRLYVKFVGQYLKSLMEYRADFILGLLGFFLGQGSGIAFIYIVFEKLPNLQGWSFNEMLFIYGFAQLPRGLDHLFTDNLWSLSGGIIANGGFDRYLLRPINPLFQLIAERFQPDAFGEIIMGVIIVFSLHSKLNITINFVSILLFIFLLLCGAIIYTSIKLTFASLAFWLKYSQSILFINYMLSDFTKYPITIYSKWIRVILTFVIPFAFTAFFPASYFVGRIGIGRVILGSTLAAVLTSIVAYTIWSLGIKAYESVGN